VRFHGLKIGYKSGVTFLSSISNGGLIAKLTEVAKILGLVVVGSMCASMVKLVTPLVIKYAGAEVAVQSIFDSILTGILPLGLTFGIYKLLQKGFKTTTMLWGMIALGIIGSVLGIL
jgi:PTS system mannose-specific IID component/fructoselysine and glucoselysine-specific PTS system IID component